ncbi:MAG: hypothetical protein FJW35_17885, partial [Acidobacteria bacterium]|nr:hypothetical protein [Acidobacteriota bacterium]
MFLPRAPWSIMADKNRSVPMHSRNMSGIRVFFLAGLALLPPALPSGFAAVRFDVVGSPTEVIHTGRSEVLGSVNLIVRGSGNVTGTSSGGASQIGLIFDGPALAIDNTTASGIRLFAGAGFAPALPAIVSVENRDLNGQCAGFISISFPPGAVLSEGDFVRIEGVRGRIDAGPGITPGTDLFVDLQSINDPTAMSFTPDRIRVAKTLKGLHVLFTPGALGFDIQISEGFERAFVDLDASDDGVNSNDRTDSGGFALGAPTNSTQVTITLYGLPSGIADVIWPLSATAPATGAWLRLLTGSHSGETSTAVYGFESVDQVGRSDQVLETFTVAPFLVRGYGRCNTDLLTASATLGPAVPPVTGCDAPSAADLRPRFLEVYEPVVTSLTPPSITVAGEAFTLKVYGAGFAPGFLVIWNGSARPTTYVSRNELQAAIPAADIARIGWATVTVAAPAAAGGALSNPLTFNITAHPLSLFFPRLSTGGGNQPAASPREYTGMALANISGRIARLKLTALDESGTELSGPDISNPVAMTLAAGEQSPFIAHQAFGPGIAQLQSHAWIKTE